MREIKRLDAVVLSVLVITFVAVLLAVTPAKPVEADTQKFYPTADTEVDSAKPGSPSHSTDYNMYNGWSPTYGSERNYLKFDISSIPSGSIITSAVLSLMSRYGPSYGSSYIDTWHLVDAYGVNNDDWSETTLTWDLAQSTYPIVGSALDTENFQGDLWVGQYKRYYWDVTSFVVSQFAGGDSIISLCLKRQDEGAYESAGWFYTKDGNPDANKPYLEVTWRGAPVTVTITPETQTGSPGSTLDYTVTVKNNTGAAATFDLTVENTWVTSIPSSVGPISNGSTEDVTLTVTCQTAYSVQDTIKVTATCRENHMISANDICIASTTLLTPGADAFVNEHSPDYNGGSAKSVYVGTQLYQGALENCRGYWKFDLSDMPSGATIDNAQFKVFTFYGGENGEYPNYGDATLTVTLKEVSDDSWGETTITWTNKPSMGSSLGSVVVPPTNSQWYSWNITSFVASQVASGDRIISLGMVSENEGINAFVPWTAKEDTDHWTGQESRLIVQYHCGGPVYGVTVNITPTSQSGPPGSTLTYTVTVKNTGNVTDTYSLTTADNAGWTRAISPTSLQLAAGAENTATLYVTIPSGVASGASDNVRVTATGTGVSAENSCIAIAGAAPQVEVSISPTSKSGLSGSTFTFTVTVKNTSTVSDTYSLTKSDNTAPSWPSSLSKTSIGPLAPGASGTATLSVTIPKDTAENVSHMITVTATSQANPTVKDNASCVVLAIGSIRPGVWVGISPSSRENIPGGTLRYFVTVTNMGNVTDDYTLSATDNSGWSLSLPSSVTDVVPAEDRTVTLTVVIPDNAADNDSSTITVTATSRENTAVENSATCTARCVITGVTSITISPSAFTLFPGYSGQVQSLTATLRAGDNPLQSKTVTWSVTAGSVSPSSGTTDAFGRVYVVYTAPTVTAETPQVTITASFAGDDQYRASSGTSLGIPATQVTVTITPSGGTVPVPVPGIAENIPLLEVPSNALSENMTFTVLQAPPESISNYKMVSYVFDIGPSGTTFATPSTLTLPYDESELPAGVSEDNLAIYRRTSAGGDWELVGGDVNATAKTVSVQIDHLSEYAVMASTGVVVGGGELPWLTIGVIVAVVLIVAAIAIFLRRR